MKSNGESDQGSEDDRRERTDGLLTTGDMARLSNNTLRTVRFYEEAGILRPERRSAGGHRLFSQRELARLQFISDMRAAGLSLEEIRDLLALKQRAESGQQAASRAVGELEKQLTSLDERIALLTRLRDELARTHEILSGCKRCENHRNFPGQCDACGHIASQPELPQSMQVLWSVPRDGGSE
ncbi:MAG: MerR family transcriptional regulator [Polyangiaceae bacterium]|nr:MerR family transcriptional regulator [Polyangiaceae bacterium]